MKKTMAGILVFAAAFFGGCASADPQYEPSHDNEIVLQFDAPAGKLKKTAEFVMSMNKWAFRKRGDGFAVSQTMNGGKGVLYITFEDGAVRIDTSGSVLNGQPFVPGRMIEILDSGINANLPLVHR